MSLPARTDTGARRRRQVGRCPLALTFSSLSLLACVDSTGPPHPLIEETRFAETLEIELGDMRRIGKGVYVQDLVVGTGVEVASGNHVELSYDLWVPDGRHVQRRERLGFVTGCHHIVVGLETGIQGLRVGGVRRIVVPARAGYGEQPPWGVDVPPHSILVFVIDEVRVLGRRPCDARL